MFKIILPISRELLAVINQLNRRSREQLLNQALSLILQYPKTSCADITKTTNKRKFRIALLNRKGKAHHSFECRLSREGSKATLTEIKL